MRKISWDALCAITDVLRPSAASARSFFDRSDAGLPRYLSLCPPRFLRNNSSKPCRARL